MELLEREAALLEFDALLADAARGVGRLVLVGGEAGVGKSSLVRAFSERVRTRSRLLEGSCDALTTPRPLGPFVDMAGTSLFTGLARAEQLARCRALLSDAGAATTVAIVEDLHWADEATLDAVRFVARRLIGMHTLLLVTYRDDEVPPGHPTRTLIGDVSGFPGVTRMAVGPLSRAAVTRLAAPAGVDADQLYESTGGNAFFVTEVLAAGGGVPATVRDAVLARAARLTTSGRRAVEVAAIMGFRSERDLLASLAPEGIDEVVERGMLRADGDWLEFRHEIARVTVVEAILPGRARSFHGQLVQALVARAVDRRDPGRLAHHAEAAGLGEEAHRYALLAADAARHAGAHREAAEQLGRALRSNTPIVPGRRAQLLDELGMELHFTGRVAESVDARAEAAETWRALGDRRRESVSRSNLAASLFGVGRNAEAKRTSEAAVALLADDDCAERVVVQARLAYHHMLERENERAVLVGGQAIESARRWSTDEALALAENAVGSALILLGDPGGRDHLERSLALAQASGNERGTADAFVNLGSALGEMYELDLAEPYLQEGIEYCQRRDLDHSRLYCTAWLAVVRMLKGRWTEATDLAEGVLSFPSSSVISQIMALFVLSRVRTRRGDPDAWIALDHALALAIPTGTLQRLGPVRAARAEAAWLGGDHARAVNEAEAAMAMALEHRHPWHSGELAHWLRAGGQTCELPPWTAAPWRAQIAGDYAAAATSWTALGCPYEAARALAHSGDEGELRRALAEFERLGARPLAQMTARRLRGMGARDVPRGPRLATRENAAGLTEREVEVVGLIAGGLQNGEIAARLSLSTRTVDHHVAALLRKLDAHTRGEAAARAVDLGLVSR